MNVALGDGRIGTDIVDGFLLEEPAEVLEKGSLSDADGRFAEVPAFGLREDDGTEEVFGGELGFAMPDSLFGQGGDT